MKVNDVDFDNPEQVKKHVNDVVEVDVATMEYILKSFYLGGDKLTDRLKYAQKHSKK